MQWRRAALSYLNDVRAHKRLVAVAMHTLNKRRHFCLISITVLIGWYFGFKRSKYYFWKNHEINNNKFVTVWFLCSKGLLHSEMCLFYKVHTIHIVVLSIFLWAKRVSVGKKGAIDYVRFSYKKEKKGTFSSPQKQLASGVMVRGSCAQLKIGAISLCITQS